MEMAVEDEVAFTLSLVALLTDSQSVGVPQVCLCKITEITECLHIICKEHGI